MAKPRRRISTEWCVQTGTPSWHQQRAGHASSGSMCFWSKRKAQAYKRRVQRLRPNEPAFITSSRKLRHFAGARR